MNYNSLTSTNECDICYSSEYNTSNISCQNKQCTSRICIECFNIYLGYCETEKILPKCINTNCKMYYTSDSFKNLENYSTICDLYKKVLITAFTRLQYKEVSDQILVDEITKKIRAERENFIKEFPKAIKLVIDIAFGKKFNDLVKNSSKKTKEKVKESKRLCMMSHCNGKLNDDFECQKCCSKFCIKCERRKKENHVCLNEDIESIEMISKYISCPKCNITIEKSQGCNNMTCASCKTNFNYLNGQLSIEGSNNFIIRPPLTKLFFDFKDKYSPDVSRKLYIIENNEPKYPSVISLNNTIKKIISDEKIDPELIMNCFEKFLKNKMSYITYINLTEQIIEMHTNSGLDSVYLSEIIEQLL